jgi:hypothetical protein
LNPDRQLIGRAHGFEERSDGLYATLTLMNTPEGRRAYEAARVMGYVDVSLEADVPLGASGTVARTAAAPAPLTGVAVVLPPGRGAYRGALATAARADSTEEPADDDDDPDDTADPAEPTPGEDATAGRAGVAELVRREMARYGGAPTARRPASSGPLHRYPSWQAFANAARAMDGDQAAETQTAFVAAYRAHRQLDRLAGQGVVGRALVDQITTDNPGVMPPSWLSQVFGIVDRGRPGITALGGPRNPGDSGMDVYWPYYDGNLAAIVAKQSAEKAAVNSVKISFKRGQATLDTYGAASDVSYQLQRRSSPSYMGLHDQIMQIAYGQTTEYAFDTVLSGVDTTPTAYTVATDTNGATLRALLFAASSIVFNATGEPASVALCAPNVFVGIGAAPWLMPQVYGVQNVPGTAEASNLRVNISGLELISVPGLPAGTMIITNEQAAAWFEEGPFIVTAEDVEKLGTNAAIWGMGTTGVFLPGAVVELTVTVPAPPIPLEADTAKKK